MTGDAAPGAGSGPFILCLDGPAYEAAMDGLVVWVHDLLLPVYAREITTNAPWCPRWWEHHEAVALLYGLWMSWQEHTAAAAGMSGPALWHRDFLHPCMAALRDPSGTFAGCRRGSHRATSPPPADPYPG
ncbi:DUF4913 domain-containing protein [Streptomyces sp. NPDC091376]|uniref:DUF4913 domain-containing protein n=1 Tax=Streptomyces sp. NPDC091376 TaxID=3365994 RepID=UPI0037FAD0B9